MYRAWKQGVIDEREARFEEAPVVVERILSAWNKGRAQLSGAGDADELLEVLDELQFRQVICDGELQYDRQVLLGPRHPPKESTSNSHMMEVRIGVQSVCMCVFLLCASPHRICLYAYIYAHVLSLFPLSHAHTAGLWFLRDHTHAPHGRD